MQLALIKRFAMWLVVDSPIHLGLAAPYVFGFAIGRKPMKSAKPSVTPLQPCAVCKCRLDNVFTGIHVITNGKTQKTVCGLCAAYAITDGWREVIRAKTIGRD